MLDWVLNTPLILSSDVIWHAYRLIAEAKIFRCIPLVYPSGDTPLYPSYVFYVLSGNGLAKKYIIERYNILLETPRIFRHIYNNDHISDNSIQINIKLIYIYCIWIYNGFYMNISYYHTGLHSHNLFQLVLLDYYE